MRLEKLIKISRRVFLKKARTMFAGVAAFGLSKDTIIENFFVNRIPQGDKVSIKSYRNLGNTGFKVSDISFGGGCINSGSLVRYAVDRGVNYFDTANLYGQSEKFIGEALKEKRKDVFIATKSNIWKFNKPSELKNNIRKSIENSLRSLKTDYLDCYQIWSANIEKMKLDEVHEAFENAKKEGKVRFFGLTNHSADVGDVINQSLDDDLLNNLTICYHHLSGKKVSDYVAKAAKKGKSIVAMKVLMGAYLAKVPGWEKQQTFGKNFDSLSVEERLRIWNEYRFAGKKYNVEFVLSAQKWALSNPNVNTIITTFRNFEEVDDYLQASGQKFGWRDKEILDTHVAFIWDKYCRIGCDLCHSSCPKGVPVNDILRFQMYYENYGDKRMAVDGYSDLPKDKSGSNCFDCDAPLSKSCPYGLAVKERLMKTHGTLSRYC